jgi:hypothetical protein
MDVASVMRSENSTGERILGPPNGDGKKRVLTAAIRPGIAAVELLHVELLGCKCGRRVATCCRRPKVAFVSGIAATFAKATPEAAKQAGNGFGSVGHQSSPWAAPE